MNNIIEIFRNILKKYKFELPISIDIQKYMIREKRSIIVDVLKAAKNFSFFYGATLRIFFFAKHLGKSLTLTQSAVILIVFFSIGLATASAGGYLVVNAIIKEKKDAESIVYKEPVSNNINIIKEKDTGSTDQMKIKEKIAKIETKDNLIADKKRKKQVSEQIMYRMGISEFSAENVKEKQAQEITDKIYNELISIIGKRSILKIKGGRSKNINMMITGSIGKLGRNYMITAKVIDVEKGKSLLIISEDTESEDELNPACERIAKKMADIIK